MQLRALQTMAEGGMLSRMIQIGDLFEVNDVLAREYVSRGQAVEVRAAPRTASAREYVPTQAAATPSRDAPAVAPYTGKKRGPKPKNKMKREPSNKSADAN